MSEEELRREIARLASLTRRAAAFLEAAAASYYFFAFGMAVVGSVIVALSLADAAGVSLGLAAAIGVVVGVAASLVLVGYVAGPVWRYLASQGLGGAEDAGARAWLAFAVGFAAAYAVSPLAPPAYLNVAWYPGLAVSLAILAALYRRSREALNTIAIAAALLAVTAPAVVYMELAAGTGTALASGLVLLSYLAAGSYSLRAAATRLVKG